MTVKIESQDRNGIVREVRATIPAVEALTAAGATIERLGDTGYRVTLGHTMPADIVAVRLNQSPWVGIRLSIEPEYPGESRLRAGLPGVLANAK